MRAASGACAVRWRRLGAVTADMEGHITASPSTLREPDLGNAARLRLNVDARLMPVDRRSPEDLCVWYRPSARSRSAPHVPLADAIVAHLGMACDATAVTLRLDGYAVASADVLRDGDVVHVCARDGKGDVEHGGPWPVSPAAASLRSLRPSGRRDAPATAPPGHRPYAALPAGERRARQSETSAEDGEARGGIDADAKRRRFSDSGMPETAISPRGYPRGTKTHFAETRGDAPPERSRSARRKALKRARKREASFGATRQLERARASSGNGEPGHHDGASQKHLFLNALFLPANGALDPNGDLARHGGALAGWPEHAWVPHPSEDALRAAEASLAASAALKENDSENANATRPAPTTTTPTGRNARKIVFSDDDDDASDSEDSEATGADSDEDEIEAERASPATRPDPPRSDVRADEKKNSLVTRARLESLVAADHTLANQSTPIPGSVDPEDAGTSLLPGDVVRYRYRVPLASSRRRAGATSHAFACSYFQGEVVSVAPDFGDAGGVRLAVTIAPWPERRRTEALVCAARAAAEAETEKRLKRDGGFLLGDGDRTGDPTARLPAPFDATCVATLGTRDVLEARLIGGPRHVAAGRGRDGEETAQTYAERGGVGGALAALRAGGSLEKR